MLGDIMPIVLYASLLSSALKDKQLNVALKVDIADKRFPTNTDSHTSNSKYPKRTT